MQERALITSASNKFFPSLINLLGSIKTNYPKAPKIYVYDLGLFWSFRKELESIEGVEILEMPKFVTFWRSCYTWKTYIFTHPLARLNFYLDAGCQVLKSLDGIFEQIEKYGYFFIEQGVSLSRIVPKDYIEKLGLDEKFKSAESIHAGELGFKADSAISEALEQSFEWAKQGLALGFSQKDAWRNKGKDKTNIVRNCEIFRHDMTLLNIAVRKKFMANFTIHSSKIFAGGYKEDPKQVIWHLRLSYKRLDYFSHKFLHSNFDPIAVFNRLVVVFMVGLKNLNLFIKSLLGIVAG
ncbi:MAG: hypothetical protein COT92_03905 [Candidatus Doudnabacteria bacterium CG10_big_fil_rev_8_21_14_0_10_42_18]|uniref:Glycosyl transferase n=1 Tax=Candidatus Doudnabacteria bacterium CG10_big_fil_rev_8_21_14_0_10_42_18 TaxID=1974552 RepID=A0A2H0V9Z8_9BACT|nr:MAG: hypothetical protein COT92_03905 [Candidatus Doudnabacteria bacterium CG10_big_fil_rev_8_21_14_0_10_42_18]